MKQVIVWGSLCLPLSLFAAIQLTDPVYDKQRCIQQNLKDCVVAMCSVVKESSCQDTCRRAAEDKCQQLSTQRKLSS